MNDDELMTAVREPLADVHLTTPLDDITRRGKALRTHRRLRGITGMTAALGAIAVAAALLVPGGTSTPPPWTITKVSDDTIKITIRELKDPQGLENALRADGIKARVHYNTRVTGGNVFTGVKRAGGVLIPEGCHLYPKDAQKSTRLLGHRFGMRAQFILHASDYPKGTALAVAASAGYEGVEDARGNDHDNVPMTMVFTAKVVDTPQCTGS